MSYTNHTSNYDLPQYVGTDKPAWLSDINPAFGTIDTQLKANADDIATTNSDLALTDAKADGAKETADDASERVGTLETALDLTSFTTLQWNEIPPFNTLTSQIIGAGSGITVAKNSDASIFKCYGEIVLTASESDVQVPHINVPGLSGVFGYKTINLGSAPDEPYVIKCAGFYDKHVNGVVVDCFPLDIAVGSDGYVYIDAATWTGTPVFGANEAIRYTFFPCVYFNKSFGDSPE